MSKSRGIKSPNGRRPKKLSTHAEDDQARRRKRINLTMSDQCRKQLGDLGPLATSAGIVGQASSNMEFGIRLIHFLTHGGNVNEVALDLVSFTGDVARFKRDGSAYDRMASLTAYLEALGKSVKKVVASRGEGLGDGGVILSKPK